MCCGQLKSDSLTEINNASAADLAPLDTAFWSKQQEDLSSQGLRVLALCRCVWEATGGSAFVFQLAVQQEVGAVALGPKPACFSKDDRRMDAWAVMCHIQHIAA
jgi:hypothetical protein